MRTVNLHRPGYKETTVGWIPDEWDCIPFGMIVASSQYGLSYATSTSGKTPMLGMSHLAGANIVADGAGLVDITANEFETYRIRKGDFLFNRTNSLALVGKSAVANADIDAVFASYLVRFKLNIEQVLPRYVAYFFSTHGASAKLSALATPGVSQYNINPTTLQRHFWLAVPPIQEQARILSILEAWESAIEQVSRLAKAHRQLKKGLTDQLISGVDGSRGSSGKLGDFFRQRHERGRSGLPVLSVTMDRGIVRRSSMDRKLDSNLEADAHLLVKPGDIAYNMMRMWQGAFGVAEEEGIVSPAYVVCSARKGVSAKFAGHLFRHPAMLRKFSDYSYGITGDRLRLYYKDFAKIPVRVPPIEQQRRIADVLDAIDREIELLNQHADALSLQKKGLLQKLLTGQIRVKT